MTREEYDAGATLRTALGLPPLPPFDELVADQAAFAAATDTESATRNSIETCRAAMDTLTLRIKDWCDNLTVYLFSSGQHGSAPNWNTYRQFGIDGEPILLAYNALPAEAITPALIKQRAALDGRMTQAMWLKGLAG